MDIVTYTHARQNLKSVMDKVTDDSAPVIITRGDNPPVVMMALDDFSAYETTAHLMRSPANRKQLEQAMTDLETGKVQWVEKTLDALKAHED